MAWLAMAAALAGCASNGGTGGMAAIPASSFMMGCNQEVDSECLDYEKPYHEVSLSGFEIDIFETTQEKYAECLDDGGASCGTLVAFEVGSKPGEKSRL
jgi:formylglycine-generating enzyme required for sulfatase activity